MAQTTQDRSTHTDIPALTHSHTGTLDRMSCALASFFVWLACLFCGFHAPRFAPPADWIFAYRWAEDRSATFRHEYETEPRHWQKRCRAPKYPLARSIPSRGLLRSSREEVLGGPTSFSLNYRMKVKMARARRRECIGSLSLFWFKLHLRNCQGRPIPSNFTFSSCRMILNRELSISWVTVLFTNEISPLCLSNVCIIDVFLSLLVPMWPRTILLQAMNPLIILKPSYLSKVIQQLFVRLKYP